MRLITVGLACAVALATASTAQANDVDVGGRFGVGADAPIGFIGAGAHATYWATPGFGAQLQLGANINTGGADGVTSISTFNFNLRALIKVMDISTVRISGLAGFGLLNTSVDPNVAGVDSTSSTDYAIELGVRPEWFLGDSFSLHMALGIALGILGDRDDGMGGVISGSTTFSFLESSSLLGEVGFSFYF